MFESQIWIVAQQEENCHKTKQDFDDIFFSLYTFRGINLNWKEVWTANYEANKEYIDAEWVKMMHYWKNRQYFEAGTFYDHCLEKFMYQDPNIEISYEIEEQTDELVPEWELR